jgi:hypothetical protein
LLLNGRKHLAATSQIVELDLAEICQESLNVDKILHNFDDYALIILTQCAVFPNFIAKFFGFDCSILGMAKRGIIENF